MPADLKDKAEELRLELIEKVAEQDDTLMNKYFEEGTLSIDEIKK
jgi:elongation factor G